MWGWPSCLLQSTGGGTNRILLASALSSMLCTIVYKCYMQQLHHTCQNCVYQSPPALDVISCVQQHMVICSCQGRQRQHMDLAVSPSLDLVSGMLPATLRVSPTLGQFQSKLKAVLFRSAYDSARSWLLRLLELRLTNFPTYLLTYMGIISQNRVSRHDCIIAVSLGCFVSLGTSLFQTNWHHLMPSSICRHHWSSASILHVSIFDTAQQSKPYRNTGWDARVVQLQLEDGAKIMQSWCEKSPWCNNAQLNNVQLLIQDVI